MRTFLAILALNLLMAFPARAETISEQAMAIETEALSLRERMGGGGSFGAATGTQLTWGQQVAAEDMERLTRAAESLRTALPARSLDDVHTQLTELRVAAGRVRGSLVVANLDEEGQRRAQALLARVEGVNDTVAELRRQEEERRAYAYGPRFTIGIGFGFGYRPCGWYPYYPYGYPGWGCRPRRCR
ncbi:MAG: hypothetical protein AB1758_01045 [Candidatus Eremiobacterota bacterium]